MLLMSDGVDRTVGDPGLGDYIEGPERCVDFVTGEAPFEPVLRSLRFVASPIGDARTLEGCGRRGLADSIGV
jgi:hypothetical protein